MKYQSVAIISILLFLLSACSVTRHVPDGQFVVSRVVLDDASKQDISNLRVVVGQNPYHRTFGMLPVSTWIYNLAGSDTTRRFNKWLHKVGTEPPIYSESLTRRSEVSMQRQLHAAGFLDAKVSHRVSYKNKKATVHYLIDRQKPKIIETVRYDIADSSISARLDQYRKLSPLKPGERLDRRLLEQERASMTEWCRNQGLWDFNKENVYFLADTLGQSSMVDLKVVVTGSHKAYRIGTVTFVTNYDLMGSSASVSTETHIDTLRNRGFRVIYEGNKCYLRPDVLVDNCYLRPGELYTEQALRATYAPISRLQVLKYVNIRFVPDTLVDNTLNCIVNMSPYNPHSVQFELDGTNTSGDLGFAAACTYSHKNIFRGAERYTATVKGGYESLSGNMADLVNDNYREFSVENSLTFPKFLFPFMSDEARLRSRASTDIKASYSYQSRPEYTRIITNAAYSYKWLNVERSTRHVLDVLNLSYVFLPKRSSAFDSIMSSVGPFTYSSYKSHLILSMDYTYYCGNTYRRPLGASAPNQDLWSLRISPEVGGNALQIASRALGLKKSTADDSYHILGLRFEQFARLDVDFSYSKYLTSRSRLAFHWASGIAVPYGNSHVMPFEKRYYAGGANSVRGWSVRTLGPGRYKAKSNRLEYFNQCGDVRLDASVELRSKLFWKFEFASFIDMGNVWTLKEYDGQEGGAIGRDFYKQIAASYGVGLRFVSDYFVLRLDMGVKAYDPTQDAGSRWVYNKPQRNCNRTLHFAVGYPF